MSKSLSPNASYRSSLHINPADTPRPHLSLAISHALETTNVGSVPCEITRYDGPTTPNPYYLPWIMRGLLEEDLVKTELSAETEDLLRKFDEWKPTTKALKDVKFRLEAVRSRL